MTTTSRTRILFLLAAACAVLQLFRPDRTNPPADPSRSLLAAASVPPAVGEVLTRACYDCHSSETRWPWYSAIAPMSWGVAHDVKEARAQFNFSEWGSYSPRKRVAILEKTCDEVREGRMPPAQYLWLHRGARLSEAGWKAVCDWSMDEADRLSGGR